MLQSKSPFVKARFEAYRFVISKFLATPLAQPRRVVTAQEHIQSLPAREQDRVYGNTAGWKDRHGRAYGRRYPVKGKHSNVGVLTEEQQEMIRNLWKCKDSMDWERALEIYKTIPENAGEDWQPVFRSVLSCLCQALRYKEARQVFLQLPRRDTPAYNFMLLMLARLRYVDEFDTLLAEMDAARVSRTAVTFCHIMSSCVASHRWSEALSSLDSLKADSKLHDGANWDVAYLLPMTACARAAQPQKVQELLKEYETSGKGPPQRNHYNCLIVACGSDGEAAQQVFQDLQAQGWTPARPDWHALMRCFTDFQEQRRVFEEMRHELPDAFPEEAWGLLLRTAVQSDDFEAADWVLQDMRENGCDPESPKAQGVPSLKRAIALWKARQREVQLQIDWQKNATKTSENAQLDSPRSVSGNGLPQGWQSTMDPNTGQPYYWRIDDPAGTTTWEHPVKRNDQMVGMSFVD